MNIIDRLVAGVSPTAGLKRAQARAAMNAIGAMASNGDWNSASRTKRSVKSWLPKLLSAATQNDGLHQTGQGQSPREITMARARDLVRNNPLASGALDTLVMNAVGKGLTLQSRVDWETLKIAEEAALEWQRNTESKYSAWAESPDCDVARTLTFHQQQSLALRTARESGDAFFVLPVRPARPENKIGLCIQLIEADRVATPPKGQFAALGISPTTGVIGGIETDSWGAPQRYWVTEDALMDNPNRKFTPYNAFDRKGRRQFFHLMRVKRPGQRRGMSYFAPVLDFFKTLGDYSDAELQAAVISAFFTVFVSSKTGAALPALDWASEGTGGGGGADTDGDEIKMGPGAVVEMPGDTTISTANPGRPNEKFDPFVQAILRQIGVGLSMPFEVLIKHFTSSYSAARAALLDAWKFFDQEREWLGVSFCQPVYERWLDFMVANGEIDAPGYFDTAEVRRSYRAAAWVGDGPGSLDPKKEIDAAEVRLRLGVTDLDEECLAFTGQTYMEKHSRIVKISQLRAEAGLLVTGGIPPAPLATDPADATDGEDTTDANGVDGSADGQ
jgi:lambda family phage portal protein